eukprot:12886101-Prorocentrum_lima.AAC.1
MLLYADDTVCMGTDASVLERLLHVIEEISAEYGLSLNQSKCELISYNAVVGVHLRNGTVVKIETEAKYLGCYFNERADPKLEIRRRIG